MREDIKMTIIKVCIGDPRCGVILYFKNREALKKFQLNLTATINVDVQEVEIIE